MTEKNAPSRWELIQEAVISPALLLIIFGVSAVVELATDWTGEVATLKPLHAQLEFADMAIRCIDIVTLMAWVSVGAFIFIAKAEAKFHPYAKTIRANAHERARQKLECRHELNKQKLAAKHELERLEMEHVMRTRINQELAPPQKFPIRRPDWSHVVSINNKVQRSDF